MQIVLCRHGETDYNVARRLQGKLETVLNNHGKRQAELVAKKLKTEEFDCAFSSPQKRCRETTEKIMKFHPKTKLVFIDNLREIDLGKYSGMNPREIDEKFSGTWSKRVDNKYEFEHEGGESYKGVDENRVKPLLREFREKYSSRKILVITHQGVARLLIGNVLGLKPAEKMKVDMPNDCIYYIQYRPHKTVLNYFLAETGVEGEGYLEK